jgi:hypothetical protein
MGLTTGVVSVGCLKGRYGILIVRKKGTIATEKSDES